jgi:hypothetical protein
MLRAAALTIRALDSDKISESKALLIIGAGAAGATAAMIASQNRVPTILVEREKRAFNLQLSSESRFITPNQYDWPADHWRRPKFPWADPPLPLEWEEGAPAGIAAAWENKLLRWEEETKKEDHENPKLQLLTEFELDKWEIISGTGLLSASFKHRRTSSVKGPYEFAMAVSCVGHGIELCKVKEGDSFIGYSFWTEDKYGTEGLDLPERIKPNVLISGGGDGGLQDFLRITTKLTSPKEIYDSLSSDARLLIETTIRSIEDQTKRAYIWSTNEYDHHLLEALHNVYEKLVDKLFEKPYKKNIESTLKGIMRYKPGDLKIKIVYGCTHFSNCYGLNRILTLLIAKYMQNDYGQILYPSARIVKVVGAGSHVGTNGCRNKASFCHGKEHDIFFEEVRCLKSQYPAVKTERQKLPDGPYNIVIIRHGIDGDSRQYVFGEAPDSNPRQILPYFWSW